MISYIHSPGGQHSATLQAGSKNSERSSGYLLSSECIPSASGFIITTFAFEEFLTHNKLHYPLRNLMNSLEEQSDRKSAVLEEVHSILTKAELPPHLASAILKAYRVLGINEPVLVSLHTHAAPVKKAHSVSGDTGVLEMVKQLFVSLFDQEAITYRKENGIVHDCVSAKVSVQKMQRLYDPQHHHTQCEHN